MEALVKFAREAGMMEVREIPEPEPGPGQVKILVKAAGVCGTDLHIYQNEFPHNPPVVLGHELSGVVAALGEGASLFEVGERVTSRTFFTTCGECRFCQTGKNNLCPSRLSIGSGVDGAFATYIVVPESSLHRLPDNVSFQAGALSEPLACAVHAVQELTQVSPADRVLITGPGTLGLLCLQVARACGATTTVIGTAVDEGRLRLARELGADDVAFTDELEGLKSRYGADGFDVVLECSGSAGGVDSCLSMVRKAGRYTQVGLVGQKVSIDIDQIVLKEITVLGTFAQKWSAWDTAIKLLARGVVHTEPLVSHCFPLARWPEAFERFDSKQGIKILLQPPEPLKLD